MSRHKNFYCGLEQEIFINHKNKHSKENKQTNVPLINNILSEMYPHIEGNFGYSRWLPQGLFYFDGPRETPEISSYPVPVKEGCINGLIDSLKAGRKLMYDIGLAAYKSSILVKGWSTHYNFGGSNFSSLRNIMEKYEDVRPIVLYLLNHPWSKSDCEALEQEEDNEKKHPSIISKRVHICADYISSIPQIHLGLSIIAAKIYSDNIFTRKKYSLEDIKRKGFDADSEDGTKLKKYFIDILLSLESEIELYGGKKSLRIAKSFLSGRKKTIIEANKERCIYTCPSREVPPKEYWKDYEKNKKFYIIDKNTVPTPSKNYSSKKQFELWQKIVNVDWYGYYFKDGSFHKFFE